MKRADSIHVRTFRFVVLGASLLASGSLGAAEIMDTTITEVSERHLTDGEPVMLWSLDPNAATAEEIDRFEMVEIETEAAEVVKLTDVVPPIHFESGVAAIPDSTVDNLRAVLDGLEGRANVRVNLVGHADDRPLSARLEEIYGDNAGLSRERAGQVAEHFKQALALPAEAVSFEWAGDTRPIATNATPAGRAKNRRVEVEV
jgi:flagellar motor protein MotB